MRLKLFRYFKETENDNFERKLLVLINILACILSFFSIITSEILSRVKSENSLIDTRHLTYNSAFWCMVLIIAFILTELALYDNHFETSRKLSLYTYTFIFLPCGLYITGSVSIVSMYYIFCLVLLNIIANRKERLIINSFLLLLIYAFIIISHQYPQYLPPEPNKSILYTHWLIDTPVIVIITVLLVSIMTETYRKEHKKLKEQNAKLEKITCTDTLTGLHNKAKLYEQLPKQLDLSYDKKSPICVFIVDIDYFKNYNNLYGNIKGDSCLIKVASVLKNNCAHITGDIYRFGGEEFTIVVTDTDEEGARILAESIIEDFHNIKIDHYRSVICNYVTVSIGVYCHSGTEMITAEEAIKNADNSLYIVKRKGRNDYHIDIK